MFDTDYQLDRVQLIPVTTLLQRITQSCDIGRLERVEDWHRLFASKCLDGSFWALCDAIPRNGFTVPICVNVDRWTGAWSMGNGHHRLCAAVLLGLDEVPVFLASDNDYMHSETTTDDNTSLSDDYVPFAVATAMTQVLLEGCSFSAWD